MNNQQVTHNKITGWSLSALWHSGGYILLFTTWYIILLMSLAFTEGWLAPWDTQQFRPPVETWERVINDFFEKLPGSALPALFIILTGIALYVYGMSKSQDKTKLTWIFALTNFLFIGADATLALLAHQLPDLWLSQPRPHIDVGYHLTWPTILVTVILLILLFIAQARVSLVSKSKLT